MLIIVINWLNKPINYNNNNFDNNISIVVNSSFAYKVGAMHSQVKRILELQWRE